MTTTEDQRSSALLKANRVRMEKARLRVKIRAAGREVTAAWRSPLGRADR